MMTLDLNPQEMLKLAEALYAGNWLLNSNQSPQDMDEVYLDMEQKVLSALHAAGLKDTVSQDEDDFFFSMDFEETQQEAIEEYNEAVFWDSLIDNLARRDVLARHKVADVTAMDPEKYLMLLDEFSSPYEKEFTENGVQNLVLKK